MRWKILGAVLCFLVAEFLKYTFGLRAAGLFCVLLLLTFVTLIIVHRHRKASLLCALRSENRETQDVILNGLDPEDRKDLAEKLGRDEP